MQYETVILELMSRVQKLEEEIAQLKATADFGNVGVQAASRRNVKVTPEMTELCYEKAKLLCNNENLNMDDLAQEVSKQTGMNFNTAKMNIHSITKMLKGEGYNRIISSDSLDLCLSLIYAEYGYGGLYKALKATKLHIEYLKTKGMATQKLFSVYDKYEQMIK